jgi:3-oxoadipate enol-lactonase
VPLESLADQAAHVARVMDALALPRDTAVFGNGFGAFVALQLALDHGGRFGQLLVADALAAFPEPARVPFRNMAQAVRAKGMQAVLDAAIGRMLPQHFQEKHPQAVEERKARLRTVDAECFARACLALAGMDLTPRLAGLRKRVLVMCGELDQTTPAPLARQLAEGIPGASYRGIENSGHCPMLEQPQALVRLINDFLDSP